MKKQDFIELLDKGNIKYIIDSAGWVQVISDNDLTMEIKSLPNRVVFRNNGNVFLNDAKYLSKNVIFNNMGNVYLNSILFIPKRTVFENLGNITHSIKSFEIDDMDDYIVKRTMACQVRFFNNGDVYIRSATPMVDVVIKNKGKILSEVYHGA